MKRLSWFSTTLPPRCLLLGLVIAMGPARITAQIHLPDGKKITTPPVPYKQWHEEMTTNTLNEIEYAKRKLAKKPDDAYEHYLLGGLYETLSHLQDDEKLSQSQNAVAAYSQAIQLKPDFAYAHYELGWCYTRMNNYEGALKAHREAEKHTRVTSFKLRLAAEKAHYAIGWDLYRLRRYDEAIAHYVKAVRLAPAYQEAFYEIGRVYLAQGNQEGARMVAQKLNPYLGDLLLKEMEIVEWGEKDPAANDPNPRVLEMNKETKPTILYKERAKYTDSARQHKVQGTVVLEIVFDVNEKITGVRIIRDLPYGITAQTLIALQKIKFKPAMKDGKPVSVRGRIEFHFSIY